MAIASLYPYTLVPLYPCTPMCSNNNTQLTTRQQSTNSVGTRPYSYIAIFIESSRGDSSTPPGGQGEPCWPTPAT
eukprot:8253186-Heterocapsa_arctica.AAC.1